MQNVQIRRVDDRWKWSLHKFLFKLWFLWKYEGLQSKWLWLQKLWRYAMIYDRDSIYRRLIQLFYSLKNKTMINHTFCTMLVWQKVSLLNIQTEEKVLLYIILLTHQEKSMIHNKVISTKQSHSVLWKLHLIIFCHHFTQTISITMKMFLGNY